MTKYYYKTILFSPKGTFGMKLPLEEMEKELNRLGELGWELVSTTAVPNTASLVVIMKNLKSNLG